jgi:hypothetical protein
MSTEPTNVFDTSKLCIGAESAAEAKKDEHHLSDSSNTDKRVPSSLNTERDKGPVIDAVIENSVFWHSGQCKSDVYKV